MSAGLAHVLLAIALLGGAIWLGGWVSLIVVARTATATLPADARVRFFRTLGRSYGTVSTIALALALVSGAGLLLSRPVDALTWWIVGLTVVLIAVLVAGVAQARALTRLRAALASARGDADTVDRVRRTAARARWLRASIGVISLAIAVLGFVAAV